MVDIVCTLLELEPWEFETRPKASRSVLARQLIVWIWVHHLGGKQIDVARELKAGTYSVSRWYGKAVERAPELEATATAVVQGLAKMRKPKGTRGSRVRYQLGTIE